MLSAVLLPQARAEVCISLLLYLHVGEHIRPEQPLWGDMFLFSHDDSCFSVTLAGTSRATDFQAGRIFSGLDSNTKSSDKPARCQLLDY